MLKFYFVKTHFTQMKVVIDKAIPYVNGLLEPYAEVKYYDGREINSDAVKDCDTLMIRTRTRCDRTLLEGSRVRLITTATIGCDHIDEAYCREAGIIVCSAPGCNARGVLQWVAAALKHIATTDGNRPNDYTLGVVGVGNVGRLVADYAASWGFRVLRCDPPRMEREGGDFVEFETILRDCDIITLHTPLNDTTRHLINRDTLTKMRPEATIINASRGGVVDNSAVAESGHRYLFDVWEKEPNIYPEVLQRATIATPHIAGYSKQGKANASAMSVRAIASLFNFPLTSWYPSDTKPTTPQPISWEELCRTIDQYCDIVAESERLKASPLEFEDMRNNYNYRDEYF